MIKLREGQVIVLDEPEYVAGHREWYRDQNRALVSTMRSGRFKVHPVFLPIINKSLLDKVIREHLLQYMVVLEDRGEGTVYQCCRLAILPTKRIQNSFAESSLKC